MWLWILLGVVFIVWYDRKSTEALRRMQQQGFRSPKGIRLPFVGYLANFKDQSFEVIDRKREFVYNVPGTVTQFFGMTTVAVMDPQYHKEVWEALDEFEKVCLEAYLRYLLFARRIVFLHVFFFFFFLLYFINEAVQAHG
jgi:hypothetical protein